MKSIREIFSSENSYDDETNEKSPSEINEIDEISKISEFTKISEQSELSEISEQNGKCDDFVNADIFSSPNTQNNAFESSDDNHRSNSPDTASDGKRRMYCSRCYSDFYVYDGICPECGAVLEDPLTEDEAEEFMEVLFSTRL